MKKKDESRLNLSNYKTTNNFSFDKEVLNELMKDRGESMSIDDVMWDEMDSWDSLQRLAISAPSGQEILNAGIDIIDMLLKKNISYGNSAISPLRLFSDASTEEQIYVRLDDKLSRLKNNQSYPGDNDIDDLIGYLILLKVARRINA